MSMNLKCEAVDGTYSVPFPFQTPTVLSYAVFEEPDLEKRILIIQNYLATWNWPVDEIDSRVNECRLLLENKNLRLVIQ